MSNSPPVTQVSLEENHRYKRRTQVVKRVLQFIDEFYEIFIHVEATALRNS